MRDDLTYNPTREERARRARQVAHLVDGEGFKIAEVVAELGLPRDVVAEFLEAGRRERERARAKHAKQSRPR